MLAKDGAIFSGLSVEPGEKRIGKVKVGELCDGTHLEIKFAVINGSDLGPTLCVTGLTHGDELNSAEIIRGVYNEVDPSKLAGKLVLVQPCNPVGYILHSRFNMFEMSSWTTSQLPGPIDMNAIFPGKKDGPLTFRIAHKIFNEFVLKADYLLDLHTGPAGGIITNYMGVPFIHTSDKKVRKKIVELTEATGLPYAYYLEEEPVTCTLGLVISAAASGIPAIALEWGAGNRVEEKTVALGIKTLKNVMTHLKMLRGRFIHSSKPIKIDKWVHARSERGGLLLTKVKNGEEVVKGQIVAEISNLFEIVERVKAPIDGVVMRVLTVPYIMSGDSAIIIGV